MADVGTHGIARVGEGRLYSENKKGVLLHYLNDAWGVVTPPDITSDWSLEGIEFISSMKGWAVGHQAEGSGLRGLLLKYTRPDITVSPTNIAFHPDVTVGALLDRTVRVSNNGSAKLIIGAITSASLPFIITADECSGQTLSSQHSCKVTYRFAPTSIGAFASNSNIPHNDPNKNSIPVTLSGSRRRWLGGRPPAFAGH